MDGRAVRRRSRLVVALGVLAMLVTSGGCVGGLMTAMWLIKGPNVDAEFGFLRQKRVAVVCQSVDFSQYRYPSVPKEIARQVNVLLARHVPKIEVIDQRKIDEWIDSNSFDEYLEVGRALEADLVLGIDLENFSMYQGQTLYQGKANVRLMVYDCKTGELLVDKPLPQTVYPPNSVKTTSEIQETAFRREFVGILADQIARHFYAHDPRDYFAPDAAAMN